MTHEPTNAPPASRRALLAAGAGSCLSWLAACGGGASDPDAIDFRQQPAASTVAHAGGSVTFAVEVSVGSATYQWQRSLDAGKTWLDILGAVAASYTLASVDYSMEGWQYRAQVSANGSTRASDPTTLHVQAPALQSRLGGAAWYDPVLRVTVLGNANLPATLALGVPGIEADGKMAWARAKAWVAALNATAHLGYADWRLPKTGPINGTAWVFNNDPANPHAGVDGSMDLGKNISAPGTKYFASTASELAYVFYNTLGALADTTALGVAQDNRGNSFAPLANVARDVYWSGQGYGSTGALALSFDTGSQSAFQASWPSDPPDGGWHFHVLVMRDGDSAA